MFTYYPRWSKTTGDYRRGRAYQTSVLPLYARSRLLFDGADPTWTDFGVIQNPIDTDEYGGGTFFFEVNMKTSDVSTPAMARLYNVTDNEEVVGSVIQTLSLSVDRVRSTSITLSGDKVYKVQVGNKV